MPGIFERMSEARFWNNWRSKFNLNSSKYVKPESIEVMRLANNMSILTAQNDYGIAQDISDWIASNYTYKLEKRWRRPGQTIRDQMGDCEDFTFLLASLLPHFGVTEYTIVAGNAISGSYSELHVWLEIDGRVIDPTADALDAMNIDYQSELRFDIITEDY